MKQKRLLILTCVLLLVSLIFSSVAMAVPNKQTVSLDSVSKKYNLKDVALDEIPDNIEPIKFNSAQELEKYLEGVATLNSFENQLAEEKIKKMKENKKQESNNNEINIMSTTLGSQSKQVGHWLYGYYWMDATYYYTYSSTLKRNIFTSCRSISTYITGWSPGVDYSQTDSWSSILDSGRTLACTAKALEKYYVLVNGSFKLYEARKTFYAEFYL